MAYDCPIRGCWCKRIDPACTCGNGEAEEDRMAVIFCRVHGPFATPQGPQGEDDERGE